MYLDTIQLENIKCFEHIAINFAQERNKPPRKMTVILGDNGTGKTTLLQAMALTLGGLQLVRIPFSKEVDDWARVGYSRGLIHASIRPGKADQDAPNRNLRISYEVESTPPDNRSHISVLSGKNGMTLKRTAYSRYTTGWLACGYGPLRRFTSQRISLVEDNKVSRLASLFGENEQLIPIEDWLIELDRRALIAEREQQPSNDRRLVNLIAQTMLKILPSENLAQLNSVNLTDPTSYIKVTAKGVQWLDSFGNWVTLSQLSDGYQSTMSWIGDLVSRLSYAFPDADDLLEQEGVVLIDEVDIHLHPTWQRRILDQLRQTFPNIQFIVTTHSPLVAANAKEGELLVLKEEQDHVIVESVPSVQGWRADQILTSSLFDLETTRDPETEQQLVRYDELLALRASGELNADQTQELAVLEQVLEKKLPAGETPEQRQLYQEMQNYITQTLREKGK